MRLSDAAVQGIRATLSRDAPVDEVSFDDFKAERIVPPSLKFIPDLCLSNGFAHFLVYSLAVARIPDWVAEAHKQLRPERNAFIVIFAMETAASIGAAVASGVAEQCLAEGYGLAVQSQDGVYWVFPPTYQKPRCGTSGTERGHIPQWILAELLACEGFSEYLRRALRRFVDRYTRLISAAPPSHDDEADVLLSFARALAHGDRRLFFPVNLLAGFGDWEQSGANRGRRDHFFHTFNNLFFGFLILGKMLADRRRSDIPDRYIARPTGISQLNLWESLWSLTCLFHDPGYMGEDFWGTFAFSIGIEKSTEPYPDLPDSVIREINNAWDTDYLSARNDLVELFRRVSGNWEPAGFGDDTSLAFDPALRKAYFSDNKCGHSLISGLYLVRRCQNDEAAQHQHYDRPTALKACLIACLSMMFHDPHARATLTTNGIPPVPFEQLPYGAVLMFADALQDDRRDIRASEFATNGVLERVDVNAEERRITAHVCLPRLPVQAWPWRIVEYESVVAWINGASESRFEIDYRTAARL